INILKLSANPEKQPPVQVGEIPAMSEGNQGFDDRELRSLVYKTSTGEDRYILVRNAGTGSIGRMETYRIDMNTCLPMSKTDLKDRCGRGGNCQNNEQHWFHSMSSSDDGERMYVAGTTAGFYVLDTEAIAHHTDAELAAGTAGCNQRSTIVSANGVIDPSKLPAIANDCVHMVVNNDPGLKAFLASNASPQAKAERYLVLLTRSRFDVYPPVNATPTGTHSAVFVPNRP